MTSTEQQIGARKEEGRKRKTKEILLSNAHFWRGSVIISSSSLLFSYSLVHSLAYKQLSRKKKRGKEREKKNALLDFTSSAAEASKKVAELATRIDELYVGSHTERKAVFPLSRSFILSFLFFSSVL